MVCQVLETPVQIALEQSSGASLAVLLCDFREWIITFDDEISCIWPKSNTSWVKWIFWFARYYIFLLQITTRSIELAIRNEWNLSLRALKSWYSSQVVFATLALFAFEIILVSRVYALYNQNRFLGWLLASFLVLELVTSIVGLVLNLPGDNFVPPMIVTHLPPSFAYLGISSAVVQTIVFILTLNKYHRSSLSTIPLVKLMIRDGSLAFLMSTVFGLTVVVYAVTNVTYAVTGYAWHLSALSTATCRLIINMQKSPISHDGVDTSTTIIFTSVFTDQMELEIHAFLGGQSRWSRQTHSRPSVTFRERTRRSLSQNRDQDLPQF